MGNTLYINNIGPILNILSYLFLCIKPMTKQWLHRW